MCFTVPFSNLSCIPDGTGVVVEVGQGVTMVKPGAHVVLSWLAHCRNCYSCNRGISNMCNHVITALLCMDYLVNIPTIPFRAPVRPPPFLPPFTFLMCIFAQASRAADTMSMRSKR